MLERRLRGKRNGRGVRTHHTRWAARPLDPGTAKVLSDGFKILVDDGIKAAALDSIGRQLVE